MPNMRRFVSILCFITLISAVFGTLPISESSDASIPDRIREGVNALKHPPTNSPVSLISKHDTALIAAPDGTIYLVELNSGDVLWSFESGPSIYSSYQALTHDNESHNSSIRSDNFFIDCGDDWELYMHGNGLKEVKLPFSAEEFISRTPYISADGGVMLGTKKSTVFLVDAKSGRVINTFRSDEIPAAGDKSSSQNPIVPRKGSENWLKFGPVDMKVVDELLYITRTDYALKYTSLETGKEIWYLMFADIEASYQCQGIHNFFNGFSSEDGRFDSQYKSDTVLPLHCQKRPRIYRIRDYSSLESIFGRDRIVNSRFIEGAFSLPAPVPTPFLEPRERLPAAHQFDEEQLALALPPAETVYSGLLDLNRGDPRERLTADCQYDEEKMAVALPPAETVYSLNRGDPRKTDIGPTLWLLLTFVLVLLTGSLLLWRSHLAVEKKNKSNNQVGHVKMQAMVSKRKKSRKSTVNNKSSVSSQESQKHISDENTIRSSNGLSHNKGPGRKLNLVFNLDDGVSNGRNVGKLVVMNKEIAKGSNGTVVLEGVYNGRVVAVKRLVQTHHDVALKEIQNLIASDQHPNIVRWYGVEYDQDFVYIALERCTCNLHDLIVSCYASQSQITIKNQGSDSASEYSIRLHSGMENNKKFELWKANGYPSPQLLKLMRDIVCGLAHLHELGIIHRDLKPQNVLILGEKSVCAKISDMGISKHLAANMSSLTKHTTGYGTSGWQAPEQLLHERQTRAVDLFSLGCLLFFCITGSKHPFGDNLERDLNIVNNRKDLFLIENIPEALDLISSLLERLPELRPKAADVLHHPIFWDSEMRLSFLRDASDRVELEDRETDSKLLKALESIGTTALGGKWDEKLESSFINDIGRYRRYKYDSVRDLLRVIRNKLNHYRELSPSIQAILGQVPEGFDSYFTSRFPKLLIEVYRVIREYCDEEEFFRKYFKGSQI